MSVKKTIAIIGNSSNAGTAIAAALMTNHYRLLLLSENSANLNKLLGFIADNPGNDAEVIDCLVDASWEADIIIMALEADKELEVAAKIKEVASCKLVISLADNQIPAGSLSSLLVKQATESLQKALPNSKVVKVFNWEIIQEFNNSLQIDGKTIPHFLEDIEENYSAKYSQSPI